MLGGDGHRDDSGANEMLMMDSERTRTSNGIDDTMGPPVSEMISTIAGVAVVGTGVGENGNE